MTMNSIDISAQQGIKFSEPSNSRVKIQSPALNDIAGGLNSTQQVKHISVPQGGYSVSKVALAQGQQQVTSSQIAQKALYSVGKELLMMKRNLEGAYQPNSNLSNVANQLSQQKHNIKNVLNEAKNDDVRVVDSQLKINLGQASYKSFSVPGLNLSRLREHNEQIKVDFPQFGSIVIDFNNGIDDKKLISQVDRSLIPIGLRASANQDSDLIFRITDANFEKMQDKVMVTGQGHRYPAGQPNLVSVKPEPEGVEDLNLALSQRSDIPQILKKVNGYLSQVQQSIGAIKQYQSELTKNLSSIKADNQMSLKDLELKLETITFNGNNKFTPTFETLTAQANVHRHTVVALLR